MRWFLGLSILMTASLCCTGCVGVSRYCGEYSDGCSDCCGCDDCGPRPIPLTPMDDLRAARRSLICGGGCGEVYYGEWASTPPDCCDPCDSCGQWIGGDGCKCLPLERIREALSGLVGKRFYDDESCDSCRLLHGGCGDPCGCGDCGCDDCGGAGCADCGGYASGNGAKANRGSMARTPRPVQQNASVARSTTLPVRATSAPASIVKRPSDAGQVNRAAIKTSSVRQTNFEFDSPTLRR